MKFNRRAFFGIWIKPGEAKGVSIPQDVILHITQATILTSNDNNDHNMDSNNHSKKEDNSCHGHKLLVIIEDEYKKKKEFALCHLLLDANAAQCHKLNLRFMREDGNISFQLASQHYTSSAQKITATTTTTCVHLVGQYIEKQNLLPSNNAQVEYYYYHHQPDYFPFVYDAVVDDTEDEEEEDGFLFGYNNDAFFYDQDDDNELDEEYDDHFPLHDMIPELYSSILSSAHTVPKSTVQFEDITDKE